MIEKLLTISHLDTEMMTSGVLHDFSSNFPPLMVLIFVRALMPTVLFVISLVMWSVYHNNNIDPTLKLPLPPGSMGLPIVGETLMLIARGQKFYESRLNRHGEVYKTHILGMPVIRVIGAENTRKILMNENNLVTVYWPTSVRMLLGEGTVANAIGNIHRTRRRALQKAFNHDAMADYVPVMQRVVKDFIRSWCNQDTVFGYPECKNMSFTVACNALVGFNMKPEEHRGLVDTFTVFIDNLFCLPYRFPGFAFAKGMAARRSLLQKIEECLDQKKKDISANLDPSDTDFKDAMTRLLEIQGEDSLTVAELKDLCLELLFAGHATIASAATSILIHLNKNSDVMTKIQTELEEKGLSRSEDADLTLTSLGDLDYVSAVVKEILRMSPPVGGAFRTVLKSFALNGYQIPAGWTVVYSIRETQKIANIFADSEKFDPDRWLNCQYEDEKFHYLPFGGGPRACVGKEFAKLFLRLFVIELVRSCTWRLENGSVHMNYLPVPHPADGLPVNFSEISLANRPRANTF